MAAQTARLMFMQGRVAENPIDPSECMAFDWAGTANKTVDEEITTEERCNAIKTKMGAWVTTTGGHNG